MLCSPCVILDEAYSFFDKFGSQRSLQISLLAAVGKKKNQYFSENGVLISVLKYKASVTYTSCQEKRKQLNKCWLLKLIVKVSVKKITEVSDFKIFQLYPQYLWTKQWRKFWTKDLKEFWQIRKTKHSCNMSWVLRDCYKMTFAESD